jgi:hypothetical protein
MLKPQEPARKSQMLKDRFKAALTSAWLTWKRRFLMKCTNETVTVELKSGRLLCYYATATARDTGLTRLHRHDHQWLNRISLAANEHKPPHSKNDRQGRLARQPRSHLHPRQRNPTHHPARLVTAGQPARRRRPEAKEQASQGSCGPWWPRRRSSWRWKRWS